MIYVNLRRLKRKTKEVDEPFILASQATQVFYCKDHSRPADEWHVVLDVSKRLAEDVDSFEDPLVFEPRMNENVLTEALRDDVISDNDYPCMAFNMHIHSLFFLLSLIPFLTPMIVS